MSLCNLLRRSPLFHRLCSATNTTTSRSTVRISHIQQRFYNIQQRFYNAPRLASSLVGQRLNLHDRVQSLIRASDLDAASRLARQSDISEFSNTRPTVFTCNAIIAAMYRAKRYSESISLFQYFFKQSNIVPNLVSYNQIINAHCDEGNVEEALEVYRHILANAPFAPSSVTYRHLTKGLVQAGRIGDAVSLLREMLSKGQAADSMVYNNLIRGYLDLADLEKADELFDELKSKCKVYDGIVNATWMEYWFKQGNDEEAMKSYRSLLDKKFRMHPPTGNVLLEVFLKYGKKTEAWALFNEMLDNHTPPNILSVNSQTISIMVNECFKMGQFSEAIDTFKKVGSKPTSKPFVLGFADYSNIVTRFCEQGMIPEAETFFSEGLTKGLTSDAPSHRAMINAYLKAERFDDALKILNRMVDVNLSVVADFGMRVFGELIMNNKLTESAEVLTKMGEREPKPDPSFYDEVVGSLCDGGALDQAKDIICQMVGHGVRVSPPLRRFIIETFENAGRREEIEKTLISNQTAASVSAQKRKVLAKLKKSGEACDAILWEMDNQGVEISYADLIRWSSLFDKQGRSQKALEIYYFMEKKSIHMRKNYRLCGGKESEDDDDCFEINSLAKAAAIIAPSVVNLHTPTDLYGSGVLLDKVGRIITCAHNIIDLDKFKVSRVYRSKRKEVWITLSDGQKFRGTVLDCDSDYDLALVKIEAWEMSFYPAKFGAYSDASVGDWVVSVGNTFKYAGSVSKGIISCLNRTNVEIGEKDLKHKRFLQTDCAVHEGNSGGPVANLQGEVIGINWSHALAETHVAFAIPIDIVLEVMKRRRW